MESKNYISFSKEGDPNWAKKRKSEWLQFPGQKIRSVKNSSRFKIDIKFKLDRYYNFDIGLYRYKYQYLNFSWTEDLN